MTKGTVVMALAVPDRTGASRMQAYFAHKLIERGYSVRLLHGPTSDIKDREDSLLGEQREFGVETVCLPILRRPVPYLSYRMVESAAEGCIAIVGVHQRDRAAAMTAAVGLGVPGIVAAQNQHSFGGRGSIARLKRLYYGRRIKSGAALVVCTSETVRTEMIESFGLAPHVCVVLPNGIPTSDVPPSNSARPSGGLEFIAVGRLDPQKGYEVLLRAWHQAALGAHCRLRIVGGLTPGNGLERSRRYAQELNDLVSELDIDASVAFEGRRDDVRALLGQAQVFLHSALWEGPALPLAIMEAMDASLPIVMTDCSGWPDGFIQGTHGEVVTAGSVDQLAEAIRNMSGRGRRERDAMGRACRDLVRESYDIEVIGNRFVDLVEGTLSNDR